MLLVFGVWIHLCHYSKSIDNLSYRLSVGWKRGDWRGWEPDTWERGMLLPQGEGGSGMGVRIRCRTTMERVEINQIVNLRFEQLELKL